ncbi:MAG: hypothetical protein ISEC1_P1791 [Thiomicrorhabdus sp.]|nr:MAG: hypothetical protein ISEC1_P1791 [Thiomicrorhabdus sp.]
MSNPTPIAPEKQLAPSLLIIGSDQATKDFLDTALTPEKFQLTFVDNANQAKQLIFQDHPSFYSAYLFDNDNEHGNNLALLKALKTNTEYSVVPAIFQTDTKHPKHIEKGLENGAYFYLLKPYTKSLLLSVLYAAINSFTNHRELNKDVSNISNAQSSLQTACFHIKTLEDARSLSCVLAFTTPKPKETVVGLFELMMNAIEHGNLKISYQEKSQLIQKNQLNQEISRRQALSENRDKIVKVDFERKQSEFQITISDSGEGFDYLPFLDFSLERAMDNHGRGIMIANKLSFDDLQYQKNGTTVIGRIFI